VRGGRLKEEMGGRDEEADLIGRHGRDGERTGEGGEKGGGG